MELKEFVKTVIMEITEGIKESKDGVEALGGKLSPNLSYRDAASEKYEQVEGKSYKHISMLDFEINLTEGENKATSKGLGVLLGSVNLGAKQDAATNGSSVTSVKFSIPVIFP